MSVTTFFVFGPIYLTLYPIFSLRSIYFSPFRFYSILLDFNDAISTQTSLNITIIIFSFKISFVP